MNKAFDEIGEKEQPIRDVGGLRPLKSKEQDQLIDLTVERNALLLKELELRAAAN